jgi:UDP-N-acetylmuramate--alanine ligase
MEGMALNRPVSDLLAQPEFTLPTNQPVLLDGRHVHFVGIGGCGMSGLARMAQQQGAICSGSDHAPSTVTEQLSADGFTVSLQQTANTVPDDCDLLVISAAIKSDHPELSQARRHGVQVIKYAQLLGKMMIGRMGVAIAGTHGKSTTTSMLSHILIQCGLDPSFIVGANCPQIGGGFRCGESDILIAEACEFDRSFHNFHPTHATILNVEADHLDIYSGLEEIVEAFAVFARMLPPADQGGSLLIQHELPQRMDITGGLQCDVTTIGFSPQSDYRIEIKRSNTAKAQSDGQIDCPITILHRHDEQIAWWRSPMPGEHMAYDAASAAVNAHRLGADWDDIGRAIESFQGLERRMEHLGQRKLHDGSTVTVIDDYGHHPTEIDTTLRALRRHYSPKRVICVFQPHQHSRTRFLLDQFATSFSEADVVIVPHIYFVRDSLKERQAVRASDLVDRLRKAGKSAMHLYPFDAIIEHLQVISRPGDLVVTMGAGPVWEISHEFLKLS